MSILLVIGVITIIALYWWMTYQQRARNGFSRSFRADALSEGHLVEFDKSGYYYAGHAFGKVYFGNNRLPDHVLSSNHDLSGRSIEAYTMPVPIRWGFADAVVQNDRLYFVDRSMAIICSGPINSARDGWSCKTISYPFSNCLPLDTNRYLLTVVDTIRQQYDLALYHLPDSSIRIKPVLTAQGDGFFSVDGMLRSVLNTDKLVYTYFYRNTVLVMDDSLHKRTSFHTIDTVTTFASLSRKIHNGKALTLARPSSLTNRYSCVYSKYLLIQSGLRADNETPRNFSSNSVIDVYDLDQSDYRFSFYIPHLTRNGISSLGVVDSTLVVTYKDRFAASFRMSF